MFIPSFSSFYTGAQLPKFYTTRLDEMFLINACFIITCIDKSDKNNSTSVVKITF